MGMKKDYLQTERKQQNSQQTFNKLFLDIYIPSKNMDKCETRKSGGNNAYINQSTTLNDSVCTSLYQVFSIWTKHESR